MKQQTKRQLEGTVVSDKMSKTAVVRVDRTKLHPRYGKRFIVSAKYKVHDEKKDAHIGDVVRFEEARPMSKDKRWRLVEILKKAEIIDADLGVDEDTKAAMSKHGKVAETK